MQQKPRRFLIPKFQNVSLIVLSYGPVELTARQLTLLLLAGLIGYNVFHLLAALPVVLRIVLAALPVLLLLPFGFVSIAGRTLDAWLVVLLRYRFEPRTYIWRPRTKQQGS